jgi:hypothetical protein
MQNWPAGSSSAVSATLTYHTQTKKEIGWHRLFACLPRAGKCACRQGNERQCVDKGADCPVGFAYAYNQVDGAPCKPAASTTIGVAAGVRQWGMITCTAGGALPSANRPLGNCLASSLNSRPKALSLFLSVIQCLTQHTYVCCHVSLVLPCCRLRHPR